MRVYLRQPGKQKIRLRAEPGTPEFDAERLDAMAGKIQPIEPRRPAPDRGSLRALSVAYYTSAAFKRMQPRSKRVRHLILDELCDQHGDKPAGIRQIRDEHADRPEAIDRNTEQARRLFQVVEHRDREGVMAIYDRNIVINEAPSLPYCGKYRRHEGALHHGIGFRAAWDRFHAWSSRGLEPRFIAQGDHVAVLWRHKAENTGSGCRRSAYIASLTAARLTISGVIEIVLPNGVSVRVDARVDSGAPRRVLTALTVR